MTSGNYKSEMETHLGFGKVKLSLENLKKDIETHRKTWLSIWEGLPNMTANSIARDSVLRKQGTF